MVIEALAVAVALSASVDETITYTYDVHGRLVQVVHSGTVNNGRDTDYAYDLADNRTERTRTQPLNLSQASEPGRGDAQPIQEGGAASGGADGVARLDGGSGSATDPADPLLD